jgi:hypothetical protein
VQNENLKEEAFARLDAFAEKLGVAAEHLWEILVRQQYTDAAATLFSICIFTVLLLGASIYLSKGKPWEKASSTQAEGDLRSIAIGATIFCWAVLAFSSSFELADILRQVLNPEFYAYREVLEIIGR